MCAHRVIFVSLRRANLCRFLNAAEFSTYKPSLSTPQKRSLSTTPHFQELFKSRYTADLPTDEDFYSYMAKDIAPVADKLALICGASGRKLTYKQVFDQAKQIGLSLQERGYRHGDVAAVFAPNIPEYVLTLLGCAYAGLSVTLVNPLYREEEVIHQLRDTNSVVFFVFATFARKGIAAKHAVPKVREMFIYGVPLPLTKLNRSIDLYTQLFHREAFCKMFDDLKTPRTEGKKRAHARTPWLAEKVEYKPATDRLIIPYSSGTSGLPKGAYHTHATLIAYIGQVYQFPMNDKYYGDNFLLVLPMFHIFGCCCPFVFFKLHGTVVTNPLFQKTMFLRSIHKYKLNVLPVVPAILHFMATDPEAYSKRKYDLSSVKSVFSGGAPLSNELGKKFKEKHPHIRITQGYGMTEGMISATDDVDTPYESIGRPVGNTVIKLVDSENKECGRNQPGELQLKTPSAFEGYINNPEATEETLRFDEDGQKWLMTGDIVYIDDNDNLFLVDRKKELLKYKGHQVSPVEVEACLTGLKGVANVAVAGVPHESFGDVPMAFIQLEPGATLTEEEVKAFVAERMAFQNHLRGGVIFLDKIPVSRIGKILRAKIREIVKEKIASGEIKAQK